MSDTPGNRVSGGIKLYAAVAGVSLPSLVGSSITWSNNEVQTITSAGTWTSGTYTLEMTYADASSETTAAIAFDADATAIKAALAALDGLTAADLTVTGGPLSALTPVVITFTGAFANTPIAMLQIALTIVGGGTATIAETTAGRLWSELVDIVGDTKIKRIHKTKPHNDAFLPHPTGSTTTRVGTESLSYTIEETDLDAHNTGITAARALLVPTAAGAGQSGQEYLLQPLPADIDASLFQLVAISQNNAGGWKKLEHFYSCKRNFDFEETYKIEDVNVLDITWEVFADPDVDATGRCSKKYEYKTAATS